MFKNLRKPGRSLKEGTIKKISSYVVLIFICFVLVFLGLDPLPVGQGVVAYVGGEPIRLKEFQNMEEQIKRQYQTRLEQADDESLSQLQTEIRQRARIEMVKMYLLIQGARKAGFDFSDQELRSEIQSTPLFQENGRFFYSKYLSFLKSRGLSSSRFEAMVRKDKLTQKWVYLFKKALSVNQLEKEKKSQKYRYKVNLRYAVLPSDKMEGQDLESFIHLKQLKKVNVFLRKNKVEWKETGPFSPILGRGVSIAQNKDLMEIVIHHLPQKGLIPRLIRQANKVYIVNILFFKEEAHISPQDQALENLLSYNFDKSVRLLDSWIDFQRKRIKVKLSDNI